jgi:hypothetical protein
LDPGGFASNPLITTLNTKNPVPNKRRAVNLITPCRRPLNGYPVPLILREEKVL